MNDLVEFLRARYDEDEARAKGLGAIVVNVEGQVFPNFTGYSARRVLAEVDAKRRQVDLLEYQAGWNAEHDHQVTEHEITMMRTGAMEHLRLLALPYANHPDYREEWRP